uniref:Uncharacterized protein n=1 Tax=Trypanosoma vivax (strain Y486) TaxID=1055687 RepID=G0TXJ5_TRYVY|nr:conserved hypothetical protein [Trypanosoma vivax Y486]
MQCVLRRVGGIRRWPILFTFHASCYHTRRGCSVQRREEAEQSETRHVLRQLRMQSDQIRQNGRSKQPRVLSGTAMTLCSVPDQGQCMKESPDMSQLIRCCKDMCELAELAEVSSEEWWDSVAMLLNAMRRAGEIHRDSPIESVSTAANELAVGDTSPWQIALQLFLRHPLLCKGEAAKQERGKQVEACHHLLRCCVMYTAPLHVCRAVYRTLSLSVSSQDATAHPLAATLTAERRAFGQVSWQFPYARYLVDQASCVKNNKELAFSLHSEAAQVLLLDTPRSGTAIRPSGHLLVLEILRRVATGEVTPTGKEGDERADEKDATRSIDKAFWSHLGNDNLFTVAYDCFSWCLRHFPRSIRILQDLFLLFSAVGMCLPASALNPLLCATTRNSDPVACIEECISHCPKFHIQFLHALMEMLSTGSEKREMFVRVLVELYTPQSRVNVIWQQQQQAPSRAEGRAAPLYMWLVWHMLAMLSHFRHQVHYLARDTPTHSGIAVGGDSGALLEGNRSALMRWEECTGSTLHCLRLLFLHLPNKCQDHSRDPRWKRKCYIKARQKAFRWIFVSVLNGSFYTSAEVREGGALAKERDIHPIMATILQIYTEQDWKGPSVNAFIECLHAWGMHDTLKRVFLSVYRVDEKRWMMNEQKPVDRNLNTPASTAAAFGDAQGVASGVEYAENNQDNDPSAAGGEALRALGSTPNYRGFSIRLATCEMIIESSCSNNDAATAALAVSYMLRQLVGHKLASQRSDPAADLTTIDEREVDDTTEAWTDQLLEQRPVESWMQEIQEKIIPRVDEVFCKTGVDTNQRWMTDLSDVRTTALFAVN